MRSLFSVALLAVLTQAQPRYTGNSSSYRYPQRSSAPSPFNSPVS